jgi:hypothetical protein
LNLEVPQSLVLPDGTAALVRGVSAKVIDGRIDQIVYTVEKESGAWTEVAADHTAVQSEVTT